MNVTKKELVKSEATGERAVSASRTMSRYAKVSRFSRAAWPAGHALQSPKASGLLQMPCRCLQGHSQRSAFTLIELSIVLIVIGLIIGGVLAGQELINNGAIRAQIAQIEKYNAAVHSFEAKYSFLPGDIPNSNATQFGFGHSPSYTTHGDGDGIIAQYRSPSRGDVLACSETMLFWSDLGAAGLLDGAYNGSITSSLPCTGGGITLTSNPPMSSYLPPAKIGGGNFVYVWSGGYNTEAFNGATSLSDGINYFGVSPVIGLSSGSVLPSINGPTMTVNQAYNIDTKVDDGLPQSGNVMAMYLNNYVQLCPSVNNFAWAAGGYNNGASDTTGSATLGCPPTTVATNYQTYNCYDNAKIGSAVGAGGQAGVTQAYSIAKNGNKPNCALSFKFQ